jgi:hypothetical protein
MGGPLGVAAAVGAQASRLFADKGFSLQKKLKTQ